MVGNADLAEFKELLEDQTNFFKQFESSRLGEEKGIIKSDTVIELYLERLGRTYKITFSNYGGGQFSKNVYKLNDQGEYEESTDPILELFRVNIFSQKQIYNIATRPNALRDKIDQSIDSLEAHLSAIRDIQSSYFETTAKIRNLKHQISKKERLEIDITDIRERLLQFEEKGYQTTLKKQKELETEELFLKKVINDFENKEDRLREFIEGFSYIDFDEFNFTPESSDELRRILARNSTELQQVIIKLTEAGTELSRAKNSLTQLIETSNWFDRFNQVKSDFETLQSELTQEDLDDLGNIEHLSNQLIIKEKELGDIEQSERELESLNDELNTISDTYLELRKQVTTFRREFLQVVLADSRNIKIEVKPFRDSEHYEIELRKILQREDKFNEDFQTINSFIFNGNAERKTKEISGIIAAIKETAENDGRFTTRFNTLLKGLNDEQIDNIRLLYPEDKIEVQYKANEASGFKSISNASAGQKTSAILTFLLSYGNTPLLLDQPEDDLDNQLIYELIVNRLANSKNKRQIITVTHNANIPVNGDSEWVIAMNSESKYTEVLCDGSIENQNIKDAICNIMEGGREAFKLRARRYKFQI
ncbi:TrlF family AAA-like ATPase [Metabacillus litoralis]|uniref:TrlF family AAA-like ATPase n=1 Tax=Metabacillus litoralis TaxID=152268 RepID=UPI000EF5631C|nr:hypothetical protein [Metabacillus litoralis]